LTYPIPDFTYISPMAAVLIHAERGRTDREKNLTDGRTDGLTA
jgi:hypothetical protein